MLNKKLLLHGICLSGLGMLLAVSADLAASDDNGAEPFVNDPAIVKVLQALKPGQSVLLPAVKHVHEGKAISGDGRSGPYARDYTNKMVYAPERRTALYCGGNHGMGRTNDVWEFHLGSNTWHCLFKADGGDHAKYKFALMFAPRMLKKNPNATLKPDHQKNWEAGAEWWKKNVILKDGNFVTRERHGPLLVGHTWDTLAYDPVTRRLVQGTGAHCANNPWLHHKFTGEPLDAILAKFGKDKEGRPYRTMWTFDPAKRQWIPYAHESKLAVLRGMGATMLWIPEWKKMLFYVAAQNVSPNALFMRTWDPAKDVWAEIKPNGGKSVGELAFKQKIAPMSEQQTAYSTKHKTVVAVLKKTTFAYDIVKNEWSKKNDGIPFVAHDAKTVFAWDNHSGAFLLCDPRAGKLAAYSLDDNQWKTIKPEGPGLPKPPYCTGKGYFDPEHNVFVVQSAYQKRMWIYRHK